MEEAILLCGAPTRAGRPCRRRLAPGAVRCALHSGPPPAAKLAAVTSGVRAPSAGGLFDGLFSAEERGILEGRGDEPCVDDIIPVLVVAIRRAVAGQAAPGVVVRACEAYVRALRERRRLSETGESEFERARNEALDRLSAEWGIQV
jgi:hypothetical protein